MDSPDSFFTPPSQDERIMAAISHVSILFSMVGLVIPIIVWITQKDKSRYAVYQALQALAFQLFRMLIMMVGVGCYMVSIFSMMFMLDGSSRASSGPPAALLFPLLVIGLVGLVALLFFAYGLYAAVMTLQGKNFRYLFLGDLVDRFYRPPQPKPEM